MRNTKDTAEEDRPKITPIQMLSYREAKEVVKFGEVLTWSPDRIFFEAMELCDAAMEGSSYETTHPMPG